MSSRRSCSAIHHGTARRSAAVAISATAYGRATAGSCGERLHHPRQLDDGVLTLIKPMKDMDVNKRQEPGGHPPGFYSNNQGQKGPRGR
jgi:hypothetical protein